MHVLLIHAVSILKFSLKDWYLNFNHIAVHTNGHLNWILTARLACNDNELVTQQIH